VKAYLVTTGTLFTLLALVHLLRIVEEWPLLLNDRAAVMEAAIGGIAAILCLWAWRMLSTCSP